MKDKYKLSKRMDETMTEIRELFEKLYKTMDEMRDMLNIPTNKKTKKYFKYTVRLSNKYTDRMDNGNIKITFEGREKAIPSDTFAFYTEEKYTTDTVLRLLAGTRGIIGIEEQQIPSKE
jgi:hypothetical protein